MLVVGTGDLVSSHRWWRLGSGEVMVNQLVFGLMIAFTIALHCAARVPRMMMMMLGVVANGELRG